MESDARFKRKNTRRERKMPLRIGEKYKVKILKITQKNDGYTRIKGVSVFVKNVEEGWEGTVVITKVCSTYAIAVPLP